MLTTRRTDRSLFFKSKFFFKSRIWVWEKVNLHHRSSSASCSRVPSHPPGWKIVLRSDVRGRGGAADFLWRAADPAFQLGRPTGRKPVVDGHTTSWISTERVAFRSSCEARLRGNGGEGAAELKVGGCTNKESGFDSLFLLVNGFSIVDIITLFTSAALGLVASYTDAWSLRSSSSCSTATSWRLRRLMGHGRWTNGRFCQGCTGSISVLHVCAGCVLRIGHFRVHLSVACDWCGLG